MMEGRDKRCDVALEAVDHEVSETAKDFQHCYGERSDTPRTGPTREDYRLSLLFHLCVAVEQGCNRVADAVDRLTDTLSATQH